MSEGKNLKGDTLVEVLFSIAVFGFIAVSIMTIMQQGSISAQTSLEIGLARNQMNSQVEAIRFINSTQQSRTREDEAGANSRYSILWELIKTKVKEASDITSWDGMTTTGSNERRQCINPAGIRNAFVLDIKNINADSVDDLKKTIIETGQFLQPAEVFPRLVYESGDTESNLIEPTNSKIKKAEGIWIEVVKPSGDRDNATSRAYDFHIRACWETPGRANPMILGTIIRVYETK